MRQLDRHPIRVLAGLLLLAFALFMLSGIPTLKDARSGGWSVVGNVTWFGFLICGLLFVLTGVVVLARRVARRTTA
jgi:hypothetical protein